MTVCALWIGLFAAAVCLLLNRVILSRPCWTARLKRFTAAHLPREAHHTHRIPVPRFGGLAIVVAFLAAEACIRFLIPTQPGSLPLPGPALGASLAMFVLGFWDDLRPLAPHRKFAGQVLIALLLCCSGVGIQSLKIPFREVVLDLRGWGVLITVVWLVGTTNLVNFIDGLDGLAAGISFMLMVLLGYVGSQTGSLELEAVAVAGALLAFLYYNLPPARIYLGDGGAYFLGFQIGLLALLNSHKGEVCAALAAPVLVLALPILDTALAITRRGLRGLPIFRADRRHLHHHLLRSGFSRGGVVLLFYALTLIFLVLGISVYWSRGRLTPMLLGVMLLLLLFCACTFQFSRRWLDVRGIISRSLAMREHVEYALCLCRLLALEGRRHSCMNELWPELVSVVERLGFVSLQVTLSDGSKLWEKLDAEAAWPIIHQEVEVGRFGRLEFAAPAGTDGVALKPHRSSGSPPEASRVEIVAELIAEAWVDAARSCMDKCHRPWMVASWDAGSPPKRNCPRLKPRLPKESVPQSPFMGDGISV